MMMIYISVQQQEVQIVLDFLINNHLMNIKINQNVLIPWMNKTIYKINKQTMILFKIILIRLMIIIFLIKQKVLIYLKINKINTKMELYNFKSKTANNL